jgi:serine/threonine protein kinase
VLREGDIVSGRYRIEHLIGMGGMGAVFDATHLKLGKKVAIKVLSQDFYEDLEAISRFQREARIAGSMGHPNICEVIDTDISEEGFPYIVMEYLDGQSLSGAMKRQKRLPAGQALNILGQVLNALAVVHAKGIIHRDLKPGNIFLTSPRGVGVIAKVLDFGISKALVAETSAQITQAGTTMGTPSYMAPEQFTKSYKPDPRSDLYSCGAIMYKMVTGQTPFKGKNASETIARVMDEAVPDPLAVVPDLPVNVRDLIFKSMQKDPSKRFGSADEFRQEVVDALKDLPAGEQTGGILLSPSAASVMEVPSSTAIPMQKKKSGIKAALLVAAILVVAAGLAATVLYYGGYMSRGDGSAPPAATPGKSDPGPAEAAEVTIELLNVPRNAIVSFGDRSVVGNRILLPRSGEPVTLTIAAEGFAEKKIDVTPSKDLAMEIVLVPLDEQPPEGGTEDTGPQKKKPGKKKPHGDTQQTQTDDVHHVWTYPE